MNASPLPSRISIALAAALLVGAHLVAAPAAAQTPAPEFHNVCGASSSYNLTVSTPALAFDRAAPAPMRVELIDGALRADAQAVTTNLEDRDRLRLIEQRIRALVPQVKALGRRGVDLAVEAVREQARTLAAAPDPQLDARLETRRRELHARIDASTSTRDWQGEAFERYAQQIAADIVPLVAAQLGQRALDAALAGDLAAATELREQVTGLQAALESRLQARLRTLEPDVRRLCPALAEIDALEAGLTTRPGGRPLDLIELAR